MPKIYCFLYQKLAVVFCTLLALAALSMAQPLLAQPIQDLPGPADPNRTDQRLQPQIQTPPELGALQAPKLAIPNTPEGAETVKFILHRLDVAGVSAYTPAEISAFYETYLGTEITLATLFEIMAAIQNQYLQDGYTLTTVFIPNQDIQSGTAQIHVVEGFVSQIELAEGLRGDAFINDIANRVLAMRPLNMKVLERLLLVANSLPNTSVSAVLAQTHPSNTPPVPGAVRLVIVENETVIRRHTLSIDNHGSLFAGPVQEQLGTEIYDIAIPHSVLALKGFQTASNREQRYGAVSYSLPLFGASGTKMSLAASLSRSEPGENLDILDVKGQSRTVSAGISYPIIRQRSKILIADAAFEVRNSRTKLLGDELYDDRIRVIKFGLNGSFSDSWAGVNMLDLHFSRGFDILGARETGSVNLSRILGVSDFSKAMFYAARSQFLPRNLELYGAVNGQYGFDPLLSSEEFGFGGDQMGRGYDPSEILGDRGLIGTIELRRTTQTTLSGVSATFQPYLFFDIGKIWNIDGGDTTSLSAASAGAGISFNVDNQFIAKAALAFPLTKNVDNPHHYTDEDGARLLLSLTASF